MKIKAIKGLAIFVMNSFFLVFLVSVAIPATVTYQYDSAGRLIRINYGQEGITYQYDKNGNIISKSVASAPAQGQDYDNDSVADSEEWGPGGDNPNYDGNNDGIPDSQQANVASFWVDSNSDGHNDYYTTLSIPVGAAFTHVTDTPNPSPGNQPPGVTFPWGFFEFEIELPAGANSVAVTIRLPANAKPDTYWKWGPTPSDLWHHWYEFMQDGVTGAHISNSIVILSFVDAERGDDTVGAMDGMIIDQGGPGQKISVPIPTLNAAGAVILFTGFLILILARRFKRNGINNA